MDAQNIDRIFWDAAQLDAPADQSAYLDRACAGDTRLRHKVEQLLQLRSQAEGFLETPPPAYVAGADDSPSERPGTMIGPFKLLEQIGEGGMGVVFMAEPVQPLRRKVALKVIKPGMDSKQVIARFEAERQALALMDHPNIARVIDAGATESGRPYFVMELVKGIPITEYCDQARLTSRQRLELFQRVCLAVQHAHQKGIIHRDLKPGNVLVTLHDGEPVPKVIDFGIAKATGQQLTDTTLFTAFAQMVGSPLYMSPEQAALSATDVDTRSDVYSLGVLLYELLTGTTPFENETLKRAGNDEMRRIIREDEPPRPSTRLTTMEQAALSTICECRSAEPRKLNQQVRGDLDWVVMKALEKDRERRYESASALAADVQRYLNEDAVEACPPSVGYRLRKYVRRNRRLLVPMAVIATVLVASDQLAEAAALYEEVLEHLKSTTSGDNQISCRMWYGVTCQRAGKLDQAERLLLEALELTLKRNDSKGRIGTANALGWLARTLLLKEKYNAAEPLIREAVAIFEKEMPDASRRFYWVSLLGGVLVGQEKYAEAEPLLLQGYEGMKSRAGHEWLRLPETVERIVRFYEVTNQPDKTRAWREKLHSPVPPK